MAAPHHALRTAQIWTDLDRTAQIWMFVPSSPSSSSFKCSGVPGIQPGRGLSHESQMPPPRTHPPSSTPSSSSLRVLYTNRRGLRLAWSSYPPRNVASVKLRRTRNLHLSKGEIEHERKLERVFKSALSSSCLDQDVTSDAVHFLAFGKTLLKVAWSRGQPAGLPNEIVVGVFLLAHFRFGICWAHGHGWWLELRPNLHSEAEHFDMRFTSCSYCCSW